MRALVTGASGFLGRHLVRALAERDDVVVALVRDVHAGAIATIGDDCDAVVFGGFDQVERAIAEYEIDTVFHLAAQTQVSTAVKDPVGTLEANVRGTWQVLEACRRQQVERTIVASSDKAYGDGDVPYLENQSLRPHGIYATSKACADFIAQSYAKEFKLPVAITRCGNLYGPGHTNWTALIPGTIRLVLRGERPLLRSCGNARRDFLFIEDAVEGYLKLADSGDVGAYNFGCDVHHPDGTSAYGVVQKILELTGRKDLEIAVNSPDPTLGSGGVEIDVQVLGSGSAYLGLRWRPKHSLEDGLKKTIEWYRQHLFPQPIEPTGVAR